MPQVPQYNQRTVQEQGLPGARVTTSAPIEAFGGGQAVSNLPQAQERVFNVVDDMRAKADDLRLTDFKTKLTQMQNGLIYGENGLLTKKGQNALAAPEEFGATWTKNSDELMAGLSTDRQRQMAKQIAAQAYSSFDGDVKRHVFGEGQKLADETVKAGIGTAQDDAVLNYHDAGKVQQAIDTQKELIRKNVFGFGLEQLQAVERDTVSKTHTSVIERMLANGEDLGAKKYFDQVKDQVSGEQTVRLEKALEEGTTRGASQQLTDDIMSKRLTMSQAIEETKRIEDPRLRDATTDRIRQSYSLQEAARRDQEEKTALNAANIIERTGDFNKIAPGDVAQMSLSMRSALKSYARQKAEGIQPSTDWNEYYNLKTMAATPQTKEKFLQQNLMEWRPHLADGEFKELVGLQTAQRTGDSKADKMLDGYRSDSQIVIESLQSAGFKTNAKPGSSTSKQINQFKRMVDEQIAAFAQDKGKRPNNAEVQGIADNLLIKGVTSKGTFFNTNKYNFERSADDQTFDVDVKSIPDRERRAIETKLKSRGIPVTEDKIKSLYEAGLNRMVKRG